MRRVKCPVMCVYKGYQSCISLLKRIAQQAPGAQPAGKQAAPAQPAGKQAAPAKPAG